MGCFFDMCVIRAQLYGGSSFGRYLRGHSFAPMCKKRVSLHLIGMPYVYGFLILGGQFVPPCMLLGGWKPVLFLYGAYFPRLHYLKYSYLPSIDVSRNSNVQKLYGSLFATGVIMVQRYDGHFLLVDSYDSLLFASMCRICKQRQFTRNADVLHICVSILRRLI